MIEILKNLFFHFFIFSGKLGRNEFKIYFAIDSSLEIIGFILYVNINLDNSSILNLFYVCFIILLKFIPMQAAVTKRLRDLNLNPGFVFINFIPLLNLVFRIYLSVAKQKEDLTLNLKEIGE